MDIKIHGSPQFTLSISAAHIEVLIKMSKVHYDARCREAAVTFLAGWKRTVSFNEEWQIDGRPMVPCEFRQLDTCCKIMEYPSGMTAEEMKLRDELMRDFTGAMSLSNKMYDSWQVQYKPNK